MIRRSSFLSLACVFCSLWLADASAQSVAPDPAVLPGSEGATPLGTPVSEPVFSVSPSSGVAEGNAPATSEGVESPEAARARAVAERQVFGISGALRAAVITNGRPLAEPLVTVLGAEPGAVRWEPVYGTGHRGLLGEPLNRTEGPSLLGQPVRGTDQPRVLGSPVGGAEDPALLGAPVGRAEGRGLERGPAGDPDRPRVLGEPVGDTEGPALPGEPLRDTEGPALLGEPVDGGERPGARGEPAGDAERPGVLGEPVGGTDRPHVLGEPVARNMVVAPDDPGVWLLRSEGGGAEEDDAAERLAFITTVPFSAKRGAYLNGYHVGYYPTEGTSRSDNYAPPSSFIEVTPENQDLQISEHFRLRQFLTKDQFDVWPKYLVLNMRLIDKLELVLQELNRMGVRALDMHVMSGFRTPQYNGPGGDGRAALSRHMYGDAADVWVDGDHDGYIDDLNGDGRHDIADAAVLLRAVERVEQRYPELTGGAGLYEANAYHGPFVHIDVRGARVRW
ncbi:MAG TPA: hypothetical protein VF167_03745 [Longimicrobiaceae bacterium]